MGLKSYKPYTKSTRTTVLVDRKDIWKGSPFKSLTKGKTSTGGRNNVGRITSRHKGAGHKKRYRIVDFHRNKIDTTGKVERIEYDPNRSSYIALIKYEDNIRSYIICPQNIKIGDSVVSGLNKEIKVGNCMPLQDIPPGTQVHNVELVLGGGGKLARSAGAYVTLSGFDEEYAIIKLSSGETRKVAKNCKATIGSVSNPDQKNIKIGKAGRNRWKGKRPQTRGVAMNPVDHPHGGGEGKTSGGRNPVTPWGVPTKGKRTRNNKRTDKFILKRRNSR